MKIFIRVLRIFDNEDIFVFSRNVRKSSASRENKYVIDIIKKYYEISVIYECVEKKLIIGYNIWMICLELNWFFYDSSRVLQHSEFVWTLRSSVWVVLNNFLLIDATDRSKISSNHRRIFFANTPFHYKFSFRKFGKYFCIFEFAVVRVFKKCIIL